MYYLHCYQWQCISVVMIILCLTFLTNHHAGTEGDSGFVGPVPEIKLQSLNSRKEYVYSH